MSEGEEHHVKNDDEIDEPHKSRLKLGWGLFIELHNKKKNLKPSFFKAQLCRPAYIMADYVATLLPHDAYYINFDSVSFRIGRKCHLCRVAGNTVWSHEACEFP